MEFRDYYSILGVPFGATSEQVERAYKLLVRMSHPDAFPGDPQAKAWANERMKDVNEAYTVLQDPSQRAEYDARYTAAKASQERQSGQQQRPDESRVSCPLCKGHGRIRCMTCQGRDRTCPDCHGEGVTLCPVCRGAGTLTQAEYERLLAELERAERQAREEVARQRAEAKRERAERARQADQARRTQRVVGGIAATFLLLVFMRSCASVSVVPSQTRTISPPPVSASPEQRIREVVTAWIETARAGNLQGHMEHYGESLEIYFTKRNVSWQSVYDDKSRFFKTYPRAVEYRIRNLQVTTRPPDGAYAVFDKSWDFRTSDGRRFAGDERQRLKLRLIEQRWRIVSEEELTVHWAVYPQKSARPTAPKRPTKRAPVIPPPPPIEPSPVIPGPPP